MPTIDYENDGIEHEYEATTYTLMLYEQEFKRDLIKDVFGRIDIRNAARNFDEDGNMVAMDYTIDNWNAELRTFWAMLRTSSEIARSEGRPYDKIPSFVQWCLKTRSIDMGQVSQAVWDECQRGLFRAGTSGTEEASE